METSCARTLGFDVIGTPAPQGSKRGFYNKKVGRVQMVESSKKVAPWRQDVVAAALDAAHLAGWQAPAGPIRVDITFWIARPRYHYRTGKNAHLLRDDAPSWVDKKPDLDKLERATFDALTTSAVIHDDAQIVAGYSEKQYATGRPPGATLTITPLYPTDAVAALTSTPSAATVPQVNPDPVAVSTALETAGTATAPTSVQGALL